MSNQVIAQATKALGLSETCQASLSALDFQPDCTKMLASKVLGLGVIAGSLLYKVPQILKIIGNKSVYGLSYPSIAMELVAFTISLVYNYRNAFPISTYGEYIFMIVQTLVIMFLITVYSKQGTFAMLVQNSMWVLYAGMVYALITPTIVEDKHLPYVQMATVPLFIISRATQIITNLVSGNVGTLSLVTVFLQFAGSAARVFTTLQEVSDKILLYSFLIGLVLNTILFLQVLLMPGTPAIKEEIKTTKSEKTSTPVKENKKTK